jgi:WXXGXW repeat (2 copies)
MKTKFMALLLLASSSMFAGGRFFFGVNVGGPAYGYYAPPPPPPPAVAYVAPAPGPGYTWINGYYYPVGPRWAWRAGYWAPRPYVGARWMAPRYDNHRYYSGYWRR